VGLREDPLTTKAGTLFPLQLRSDNDIGGRMGRIRLATDNCELTTYVFSFVSRKPGRVRGAPVDVVLYVAEAEAQGMPDSNGGQLAALDQLVDHGSAYVQEPRHLRDRQQPLRIR
jgi:hypothetical protein